MGRLRICTALLVVALLAVTLQSRSEIVGRIASVDYSDGMLVVRAGKSLTTVEVSPSTQIYVHGRSASLAEVRRGSVVAIRVSGIDGHLVAQIIRMP